MKHLVAILSCIVGCAEQEQTQKPTPQKSPNNANGYQSYNSSYFNQGNSSYVPTTQTPYNNQVNPSTYGSASTQTSTYGGYDHQYNNQTNVQSAWNYQRLQSWGGTLQGAGGAYAPNWAYNTGANSGSTGILGGLVTLASCLFGLNCLNSNQWGTYGWSQNPFSSGYPQYPSYSQFNQSGWPSQNYGGWYGNNYYGNSLYGNGYGNSSNYGGTSSYNYMNQYGWRPNSYGSANSYGNRYGSTYNSSGSNSNYYDDYDDDYYGRNSRYGASYGGDYGCDSSSYRYRTDC